MKRENYSDSLKTIGQTLVRPESVKSSHKSYKIKHTNGRENALTT